MTATATFSAKELKLLSLYRRQSALRPRIGSGAGGASLIAEYDNGNALQRRYVFGPGTDEPVVWYEGSGTSTRRYYHADERGSVIAVSDASGNAYAVNSYDEYGFPGTGNAGRFQYTGQPWVPSLGLYHWYHADERGSIIAISDGSGAATIVNMPHSSSG